MTQGKRTDTPRTVGANAMRAFLLDRLGLRGDYWTPDQAASRARDLGMIQIDSIRVNGLRNHEIVWAARTGSGPQGFYDLLYGQAAMRETHYPIFATRRDWLPMLNVAFGHRSRSDTRDLPAMKSAMRQVLRHLRDEGPATPADFASDQVAGGFNTIKATTRALEILFYQGRVQIVGRTSGFQRVFNLTERATPELVRPAKPKKRDYERFIVESALDVLKLATEDQIARRAALHFGSWRGGNLPYWRLVTARLLPELGRPVADSVGDNEIYWYRPQDQACWNVADIDPGDHLRLAAPLDNLMFDRARFRALFGRDYKFEAYTPAAQRQFYFALPMLWRDRLVGLIDAKLDRESGEPVFRVVGLEMMALVPPDVLRAGIHRFARLAGATKTVVDARVGRDLRKAIVGRVED
ncbi:MAG: crosslink repair DNA glycosylase YcaQ family protein [Rhodospirillaceae bacterium]|nr:crosslink repair DNA glycosylase YcaQ family protein [Rhodospirillaceae bacterium]